MGVGEETTPSRGGARCGLRLLMTVSRATLEPSDLTTPGFCRTKTGFGKTPTQILGRDPRSQFCVQALSQLAPEVCATLNICFPLFSYISKPRLWHCDELI